MRLSTAVRELPVQVLRRLASVPAESALRVLNARPVETRLSRRYEQARQAHARRLPELPSDDLAIVRTLELEGVCATSLAALGVPGTEEMFAQAMALFGILAQRARTVQSSTLEARAFDLLQHPKLFEWGLAERLLRIVEAYLSLPVAYDGLICFHSLPDGREGGARSWHLDREDRRVVKIGLYVTDVGEQDGPLQVMPRDLTSQLEPARFNYKPFAQRELERRLGPVGAAQGVRTLAGPAGTVLITDTAQHFHRGCPPTRRARSAIYFSYFSRPPRHPFFCERSHLSRAEVSALTRTLTPFQRECALWWASLPRGAQWLPRSRV